MNYTTELSNLSYTNKDFNSIYVELLEYAKQISYNWDPSASDESDPGIVLLKLVSLIGDKNNYNIDKNTLELMPASVTQLPAAHQIFDQCGYKMRYYQSAVGHVVLTLLSKFDEGNEPSDFYKLPKFTMFTNTDKTIVYSSTEEVTINTLKEPTSIPVIEGIATPYTINNDPLITIENLDNRNRIYFTDQDIAENGIFITSVDVPAGMEQPEWTPVDNLEVQPTGSYCYSFGLSLDHNTCYLEFPSDVEYLFGKGVNITYIKTSGRIGNVSAKRLNSFYTETKLTKHSTLITASSESSYIDATADNVHIINSYAITGGSDPENIDEAYKNYKRVKNTFDTLVSLRDYTNYMISNKYASNGFICDRTNDIQHTYKILQIEDFANIYNTIITQDTIPDTFVKTDDNTYVEATQDSMSAFDLCVYALTYHSDVNTPELFKSTFTLQNPHALAQVFNESSVKSIQHNFKGFDINKILLVKNKFKIETNIIPKYKLSTEQKYEIEDNIRLALYRSINSQNIEFGELIDYNLLYDTILAADERIKAITLNYPVYETFIVYTPDGISFKEIQIDETSNEPTDSTDKMLWKDFRAEVYGRNIVKGVTPLYKSDKETPYLLSVNQNVERVINDVTSVSTKLTLNLMPSDTTDDTLAVESDTLRENELVIFRIPSYIEESKYSNYVKIIYHLKKADDSAEDIKISQNTKYMLEDDEFIIFFWKNSDAEENYNYIKYSGASEANIISPSFGLFKEQKTFKSDDNNSKYGLKGPTILTYFSNLPDGKGITSNKNISGTDITATEVVKNLTSDTKEVTEILTGLNTIYTYMTNSIFVNSVENQHGNGCSNFYWVMPHNIETVDGTKYYKFPVGEPYILRSDEYFMYTNDKRTNLYVYGEGTQINILTTKTPSKLSCPVVDYQTIITDGLDVLSGKWVNIGLKSAEEDNRVYITEMEQHLVGAGNKIVLEYTDNSDLLNLKQALNSYDGTGVELTNITPAYIDSNGQKTYLPNIVSEQDSWNMFLILDLNMTSSKPQTVYSNNTIIFNEGTDNQLIVNGEDKLYHILSAKNITTTNRDKIALSEPVSFLIYTDVEYSSNVEVSSNRTTKIVITAPSGQINLPSFKCCSGHYLLHFSIEKDIYKTFNVSTMPTTDVTLTYLFDSPEDPIKTIYKLKVDGNVDKQVDVKFDIAYELESTATTAINIQPLYKFDHDTYKNSELEESVLEKLNELDPNRVVDYTYTESNVISNPLLANSFLNTAHAYNPFTICEWSNIKRVNDDDTSISIVSNIK